MFTIDRDGISQCLREKVDQDDPGEEVNRIVWKTRPGSARCVPGRGKPQGNVEDNKLNAGFHVGPQQSQNRAPVADLQFLADQQLQQESRLPDVPQSPAQALDGSVLRLGARSLT